MGCLTRRTQMVVAGTSDTQRRGVGVGGWEGGERARKLYFTRIGGRREGERGGGTDGQTDRQTEFELLPSVHGTIVRNARTVTVCVISAPLSKRTRTKQNRFVFTLCVCVFVCARAQSVCVCARACACPRACVSCVYIHACVCVRVSVCPGQRLK